MTIQVLIADDHPVVRQGLKSVIADSSDMRVVGEAVDGDDVLTKVGDTDVDVVLLDVSMPGPGFLEILRRLPGERPRLLVLSIHPEDVYAVRAIRAGAAGYVTKDRSPAELVSAIRWVEQGGTYVSPVLAQRLAAELRSGSELAAHEALSHREYQVLCLAAAGKTVKEMGAELSLSPKTVSTYRRRILDKLQLATHAQAMRYAIRSGLVD